MWRSGVDLWHLPTVLPRIFKTGFLTELKAQLIGWPISPGVSALLYTLSIGLKGSEYHAYFYMGIGDRNPCPHIYLYSKHCIH